MIPVRRYVIHLDASFVFSDLRHEGFLDEAADDPLLEEVYRDEYRGHFRGAG